MGHEEQNPDLRPHAPTWLVVPYFDGDVGRKGVERPVPPGKGASWRCPSIFVDGKPGNTAFRRGVPLKIALAVANWGGGTMPAAVLVRLWWSDPTLSFTKATAIGQTTIVVAPGGTPVQTGDFTVTIPPAASAHVCLLAQVSAPLDGAPAVPDPHADRHWGQLNLVEVTAIAADGTVVVPVLLANPFAERRRSATAIEPMPRREADHLGQALGRDVRTDGAGIEADLRDADGADARLTELDGHETRQVKVTLRLSDHAGGEAAHGVVLTQRLMAEDDENALTGTLGVLITPR